MIDADTIAAIETQAQMLADAAPPLTTEQSLLLVTTFGRYPRQAVKAPV